MLLLLFLIPLRLNVNYAPQQDKLLHFGMGYLAGGYVYAMQIFSENPEQLKIGNAIMAGVWLGFTKEEMDYQKGGIADMADFLYTVAGSVVGALITRYFLKNGL